MKKICLRGSSASLTGACIASPTLLPDVAALQAPTATVVPNRSTSYQDSLQNFTARPAVEARTVTVIHEELVGLAMPTMTMVFNVADNVMRGDLSEGQDIKFVADRIDSKLTVVKPK